MLVYTEVKKQKKEAMLHGECENKGFEVILDLNPSPVTGI